MNNNQYVVAIPSYNRPLDIIEKTLATLKQGQVSKGRIFIFVANVTEKKKYLETVPSDLFHEIIVGRKGLTAQRNFISSFFPLGQYVVEIDDDVEKMCQLRGDKLVHLNNVHLFFQEAGNRLRKEKLFIWGIYPVYNPFFMKNQVTTGLKFLVGHMFGFINRPSINALKLSLFMKEDVEQSIKFFVYDGGVVRFNNVVAKTKYINPNGGIGTDRTVEYEKASRAMLKKYPDLVSIFHRDNGLAEVRLARFPRFEKKN